MLANESEAVACEVPEAMEPKEEKKKSKKRFKIAGMKINSLRSIAKHFGLGGKGKKKDLIDRIEESDVGIDDIKEIAGSELADSPDKRSCSEYSENVDSEMTSEDRRMSAASARDSVRSESRDQTNDNEDDEYEKAKRAVEDSMRALARSSTGQGKVEDTVTPAFDSTATEIDVQNETLLSSIKDEPTVVDVVEGDTQEEQDGGPVVDTTTDSPTKVAHSTEMCSPSPIRMSTGNLISPQSVTSSPHLEKPPRESIDNTDSPLTKEKEDEEECEQPTTEPDREPVAEEIPEPIQEETTTEVDNTAPLSAEQVDAVGVEAEPVVEEATSALEEQPTEECEEEVEDHAVIDLDSGGDEDQGGDTQETTRSKVVVLPAAHENTESVGKSENITAEAAPIADAAVTNPVAAVRSSPAFPLQDRIAKFIDACNSPTDSSSKKDTSSFQAEYVKKTSFGESVVVNGEVTDLSAAVSTMSVSEESSVIVKDVQASADHNALDNVENTVGDQVVAPIVSEELVRPISAEPKTSDLRAQLDNLKARFDKIATPEIREYMLLSESTHSGGVVLSVCDNGDINITKLPSENWKPNFNTFSSFDDVTETITTTKAKTPVPARHAHKALVSTHPTAQPRLGAPGSAHKHTPASGRRGAMKNMDKSAGVLATFASEAVADEQKTRNHVPKLASRGQEVRAPMPSTPSSDHTAAEKKELSPPVVQPFLALTEEMKSERDDERRRMEKRIGTLHYGRASLGIKISPQRTGEVHKKATGPRSPAGNGVRTPPDRREKERQSSPARMETPLFLPTKTREVKQTPYAARPTTTAASTVQKSTLKGTTRSGTSVKPATGTTSSRYGTTTSSKAVTAKSRIGAGAATTIKPRKTPEITRSNTTRVPATARCPPPSYARSNSSVTPGSGGKKGHAAAATESGGKSPDRASVSPVRVHKNPFGAML